MEQLKESVEKLVIEELERANKKFPMFHSHHEGYAVIKEEFEEVQNEVKHCDFGLRELWDDVKMNNSVDVPYDVQYMFNKAILLASEAIQVAAMAQKFKDSFKGE